MSKPEGRSSTPRPLPQVTGIFPFDWDFLSHARGEAPTFLAKTLVKAALFV
jgi:hypothetical protein